MVIISAYLVLWVKGALRGNHRQNLRETCFTQFVFFRLVGTLSNGSGVWYFGIYGLVGLVIPVLVHVLLLSNIPEWEVAHSWDLALEAPVDFLAVVEHRLIPARVRRNPHMLGMLGLEWLV